jgi:hypothetical protein
VAGPTVEADSAAKRSRQPLAHAQRLVCAARFRWRYSDPQTDLSLRQPAALRIAPERWNFPAGTHSVAEIFPIQISLTFSARGPLGP